MVISTRERVEIGTREPFDRVQLRGVRVSVEIEPEPVVVANGVDYQRIALPLAG